ncbi:hypothetical protein JQ615_35355 [Bradyrhizobium jicamae]|uniref:Uncharacterized protein n=1 Tax=Bradyrhizobium jicamae TaxID=280332 RepID=A0ABS5FV55_9BRAD|nr:hypothetical protein [Bradyrhizobium jicamae]MBR0800653.1 hypothetical protein [Bradyrhizobium jicamae]MBR0938367.1 hypothetical protein [Bradyrhizobium jicamae]
MLAVIGMTVLASNSMNPPDLATRAEPACKKEFGDGPGVGACTVDLIMRGSNQQEKTNDAYRNVR